MLKLNDLKIDTRQFNNVRVVSIKDWYEYSNEKRNQNPSGIQIEILCEDLKYEKIWVKVPNVKKFDFEEFQQIKFKNLEIKPYQNYKTNELMLSAKASSYELK